MPAFALVCDDREGSARIELDHQMRFHRHRIRNVGELRRTIPERHATAHPVLEANALIGRQPGPVLVHDRRTRELILRGLTQKKLTFEGKYFSFKDIPMELEPLQKPYPPMWYGVHSVESAERAAKQDQSRSASQWLAGEIASLRQKVADAESKVEQYRSKANLLVGTNNTTLSNQQLGEFNAQVGSSRALKVDAESKARIIRETLKSGGAIEFSDIVNSELMRRLSERSRYPLPGTEVQRFNELCVGAIQDLLGRGRRSSCQHADPTGREALTRAATLRRKLRALKRRGQMTEAIAAELRALAPAAA